MRLIRCLDSGLRSVKEFESHWSSTLDISGWSAWNSCSKPVFKSVLGAAQAPRPVIAENLVKEQRGKITSVIRMRVQERRIRTRTVFLQQAIYNYTEISYCEPRRVDKKVVR